MIPKNCGEEKYEVDVQLEIGLNTRLVKKEQPVIHN
jgi:hypothetical protein